MKAYKYQIFDLRYQKYVTIDGKTSIFFNLEDAVKLVLKLLRHYFPSDPSSYFEIHKIAVCDLVLIE